MVQKAAKFTPEVMLSAPRRSSGVPNHKGDTFLHTISTYSFETHQKEDVLRIVDIKSGNGHDLLKDKAVSSFNWLDNDQFVFLCSETGGVTSLCVGRVPWDRKTSRELASSEREIYVAGVIEAPAADLKIAQAGHSYVAVFAAQASPDGSLFNPDKAKKTHSTGRFYSNLFVRHWDQYVTKERNALWRAELSKHHHGKFKLGKVENILKGSGLESPIPTFGGGDHFDVCHNCIMFVAKDPDLDPAINTKCNVYFYRFDKLDSPGELLQVVVPGFEGAATSPVISPYGHKAAFLMMKINGYEADRNEIFYVSVFDGSSKDNASNLSVTQGPRWNTNEHDVSPSSIQFTAKGESLLAIAEEFGAAKLFHIKESEIRPLTNVGFVTDAKPLSNGTIFVSGSTIVDNSFYAIVDPRNPPHETANDSENSFAWLNSYSARGGKFGLHSRQVGSIWTPASNQKIRKQVHSLIIKPSNFDGSKKYPVAYLIHGGPQGSWCDSWSTRWNPAVFAEQGYIVVTPNPTGSTGYGQEFTDSIRENWGGDPYQDIVNCFDWVGENIPQADNDRAVALGASYGGYMVNWIQGHDLGRKMKALVCHDGAFCLSGQMSTDELYFMFHDLGGTPWYDPTKGKNARSVQAQRNFGSRTFSDWRRWDPAEYLSEWATPQLVIHNPLDYRLPISEGLAAFNVLQARGIDSQFLTFDDENHWVLKPENSLVWHKVVLNFINKHVGLPPYTTQDVESEEFLGGVRADGEELTEMMAQGKPET